MAQVENDHEIGALAAERSPRVRDALLRAVNDPKNQISTQFTFWTPLFNTQNGNAESEKSEDSSSPEQTHVSLVYDFDKLPQPSAVGKVIGNVNGQTMRKQVVSEALVLYPALTPHMGRPPNQEEASLLAQYIAEGVQAGSKGPFTGTLAGILQSARTARGGYWYFPLPFRRPRDYKRGVKFDPNIFRVLGREVARGQVASMLHRVVRGSVYAGVGYWLGQFYYSYKVKSSLMRASADTRLAEIRQGVLRMSNELRENIRKQVDGSARPAGQSQGQMDRRDKDDSDTWQQQQDGYGSAQSQEGVNPQDDASPTGGIGAYDYQYARPDTHESQNNSQRPVNSRSTSEGDRLSENQSTPQRGYNQWPRGTQTSQAANTGGPYSSDESDDYFFPEPASRDAAQSSLQSQSQVPAQPSPLPGSAWERLRNGQRPPPPPLQSRDTANNASSADSMSSMEGSSTEADKSQAQKDFDAMLERERYGDESSRNRRW